jgi:hypothetical protein
LVLGQLSKASIAVYQPPWCGNAPLSYINEDNSVHGLSDLKSIPEGYRLAIVPGDADFTKSETHMACDYSITKALIALGQSIYATITLYLSKGDQINRYGYAAFGLTVAPYIVMSIVNLVGNIIIPNYPAFYLVRSPIMDEAEERSSFHFSGVVGGVTEEVGNHWNMFCTLDRLGMYRVSFADFANGTVQAEATPVVDAEVAESLTVPTHDNIALADAGVEGSSKNKHALSVDRASEVGTNVS